MIGLSDGSQYESDKDLSVERMTQLRAEGTAELKERMNSDSGPVYTDPQDMRAAQRISDSVPRDPPYETRLTPEQEAKFKDWKNQYAPQDSGEDYDFRGAFLHGYTPGEDNHWPDPFKKPNHPTFSNQSIYAKDRPDLAGSWTGWEQKSDGTWFKPDPNAEEKYIPPTPPAIKGSAPIPPSGKFEPANLGTVVENPTQVSDASKDLDKRTPPPLPIVPGVPSIAPHNPNPPGGGPYTIKPGERLSDETPDQVKPGEQYADARTLRERLRSISTGAGSTLHSLSPDAREIVKAIDPMMKPGSPAGAGTPQMKIKLKEYSVKDLREEGVRLSPLVNNFGGKHSFQFVGEDNKTYGVLHVTPRGENLHVDFIRATNPDDVKSGLSKDARFGSEMPVGYMLQILRQLKERFPEATALEGGRISGAKARRMREYEDKVRDWREKNPQQPDEDVMAYIRRREGAIGDYPINRSSQRIPLPELD